MANKRSAAKQARMAVRRREMNQRRVSPVKTLRKKVLALVSEGKKDEATKALDEFQSSADRAGKMGAIHPRKAARLKSRTAKALAKAS